MKRLILIACVLILILAACKVEEPREATTEPGETAEVGWGSIVIQKDSPVKLGLGAMLTGSYANMGKDIKNGGEMALADFGGELLGHKLVLQAEDDQCEGAPSVSIAHKFCNDPQVVGVVGYMCSGGTIPASEVHEQKKVILISPSSTGVGVTNRGLKAIFRTCWNDVIQGRAAAEFVINKGIKSVAVVHDKSAYGEGLGDEFRANFEKNGGRIVAFEGLTRGEQDFKAVLTKIGLKKPELVYFGGMATEGALVARQMQQVGLAAKFMGPDGCYSEKDFITGAGKASQGAWVTYARAIEGPRYEDWLERFEANYGKRLTFSPQAYDAATIILESVRKVAEQKQDGSLVIDKKALNDAVRTIEYKGVTGDFTFEESGDRTGTDVGIFEVQGDKFVEVKL